MNSLKPISDSVIESCRDDEVPDQNFVSSTCAEDFVSVSSSVQAATPSATASDDQSTSDSLDQQISAEIEG